MRQICCDVRRLEVLRQFGSANAIEFLEVRDLLEPIEDLRQRTLFVRLLRPGFALAADNIRIDGGARVATVPVEWAAAADALPPGTDPELVDGIDDLARTLVVRTALAGDFSRYTLRLLAASGSDQPPAGFDPKLAQIEFSFKVECPSDFDCAACTPCPQDEVAAPAIDYLAKDYPGLRRLMLDRLNLLSPGWTERSAADLGVVLVELMAYAADNLSYIWPVEVGVPGNVDNDLLVILNSGKNPVLSHLLVNHIMDAKNAMTNFTTWTGYQMPQKTMTREALVATGLVPEHLANVYIQEGDMDKGSRELELPPGDNALWQSAYAELTAGV